MIVGIVAVSWSFRGTDEAITHGVLTTVAYLIGRSVGVPH